MNIHRCLTVLLPLLAGPGLSACLPPLNSKAPYLTPEGAPPQIWDSARPQQTNPRAALRIGGQPIAWRQDMQFSWKQIYAEQQDDGRILPAVPYWRINPQYLRQLVDAPAGYSPGTIIIDRRRHYLYLILQDNLALRYGVGIGRRGFDRIGRAVIKRKTARPQWTASPAMIRRARQTGRPLPQHTGGQIDNPMAARTLYIAKGGRGTACRIDGTPEWWTIGKNISAGCFRMFNQDIIDLYSRAPIGAKIIIQ